MVKSSKGIRRRSRHILRKTPRARGLAPITHSFVDYKPGTKAIISIEPSIHGGQPSVKFQGLTGTVKGKQGRACLLEVRIGGKYKQLVVGPEHLKRQDVD